MSTKNIIKYDTMRVILIVLFLLLFLVGLLGCAEKECPTIPPPPPPTIEVVKEVKEVFIEVGCKVKEPLDCEFTGSGFKPTVKLLDCVRMQKKILDRCLVIEREE